MRCYSCLCVSRYGQTSPAAWRGRVQWFGSKFIWNRAKSELITAGKWHRQWAEHFPLCIFNQVQTISNLKMFGHGQRLHIDKFTAEGEGGRPFLITMSTVPLCVGQPTESCGSPAAFLTGQTCSSCCWTERRYWFSTQRTRRLHRCLMTWPTGYQIPVDPCQNAAKTIKHTRRVTCQPKFFLTNTL